MTENQYSFIKNLSDKIDTLDTSVSGLNTFVQESRSSLTLLENQIKDIRISVEQLIILYDKLKTNSKIIKNQIKVLKIKKQEVETKVKTLQLPLKEYDKQIKKLIPEDYDTLRNQVIVDFEKTIEDLQFIKKSVWNKTKRLVTVDDNLDRIRDLLKKYSTIDEKIPNIINEVRKKEGVKKDAFLKKITKN